MKGLVHQPYWTYVQLSFFIFDWEKTFGRGGHFRHLLGVSVNISFTWEWLGCRTEFGLSSMIISVFHCHNTLSKCRKTCFCFAPLSCPFSTCWVADLLQKRYWQWEEQQETWHFTAGWCAVNHGRVKLARFTMENMARKHGIHTANTHVKIVFCITAISSSAQMSWEMLQILFFRTLQQNPQATSGWISKLFGS